FYMRQGRGGFQARIADLTRGPLLRWKRSRSPPSHFSRGTNGKRHNVADKAPITQIASHGAARLPSVEVDSYNIELRDEDGFLGDRASRGAFQKILDRWRKAMRKHGEDPFGDKSTDDISRSTIEKVLTGDDAEAAALVHSAIEDFAQELAYVSQRFLKTKAWADTQCIVIGGGVPKER